MKMLMNLCAFVAFSTVATLSLAGYGYCTTWCQPAYVEEQPGLGCPFAEGGQSNCESGTCEAVQTAIAGGCQGDEEPTLNQCYSRNKQLNVYNYDNESCYWTGVMGSSSTSNTCRCEGFYETSNVTLVEVASCFDAPCVGD